MANLNHAIVFVSDMSRSVGFYRDALGLALRFESPFWSEFETGATTLALHLAGVDGPAPAPVEGHGKTPPGVCSPGLCVDDLDAFHAAAVAKGARCVMEPEMQDFGAKLALYLDPDGLCVSVAGRH